MSTQTAYTLRPWTDVVEPHPDVSSGDLAMGTYAANLAKVAIESAGAEVYRDAKAFFAATYFTGEMRKLLADVWASLAGEPGDRVLQLRTPFGGGKTHTLLALYHLATSPQAARDVPELKGLHAPGPVRTAVLSGEYFDPQRGREVDGRRIRTLWGELAYQLGGWRTYQELLDGGEEGAPPGGEILGRLLGDRPALILIDEAVMYVARGRAVAKGDSDMAKLTMVFLQNLTEAVNQSARGALVYSLQSSVGEAVGEEQLLHDLEKIAARIDARREPVSGDEVLRVVQRRLFGSLGEDEIHRGVARAYAENYEAELLATAETEADRREAAERARALQERTLLSYPFHPQLIDVMQHRWASVATYQRTRGALQFLATVVHSLWTGEGRAGALIGPGDVDLTDEGTRSTFLEQVDSEREYRAVVEADFVAGDAGARRVDERFGRESPALAGLRVGTRVATAIMLMSFGAREGEDDQGALESEVLDATVAPELDGNLVRAALKELRGEALLYLHHSGRRYRFEPRPNLNKLILSEQDKLKSEEITSHVQRELERNLTSGGAVGQVVIWPRSPDQVEDRVPRFRAVYLPLDWSEAKQAPEEFLMAGQRQFKNGLALVLPKAAAFDEARAAARVALAVERLISDKSRHGFSEEQVEELGERRQQATNELAGALGDAYERVLIPQALKDGRVEFQSIDLGTVLGVGRSVHARVREALSNHVFDKLTPARLSALCRLTEVGSVGCEALLERFFSFFEMPKLWGREPLRGAIASGVEKGLFAYGVGISGEGAEVTVTDPSLVRFGAPLAVDEVDVGPGTALLSPAVAERIRPDEGRAAAPEGEAVEEAGDAGGEKQPSPVPSGGFRRVQLTIQATKDDLFTINKAMSQLRDMLGDAGEMSIEVRVQATSDGEPLDPIRLQNMVLQHLEEDEDVSFDHHLE
jgi:hypothetical protein